MHFGNQDLFNAISTSIPKQFFQDTLTALHESHKEACSHIEKVFSQSEAKDLLPHYRRAKVEDKMREIARKNGLVAHSVLNKTKNASHTEIETAVNSKRIILTTLSVQNRYDLTKLRKAHFRKTLAEAQMWLFNELKDSGDGYYGVLLYGANAENKNMVDFAILAFPTSNCKGWYGHYNLFDLAGEATEIEFIDDTADPKLRTDIIIRKEK
jgi:hypothetical protein